MSTLKETALLERIGELTVGYENRVADLRVEMTGYVEQIKEQQGQLQELRSAMTQPSVAPQVVNVTTLPAEG